MAPNLGWIDVPLGARLARALATAIPIAVVNDADAGVLGESRRGAAVGVDDVLYVSGEVGVGGGLIVDGRLLTGVAGFAGEIGHLTVNPDGRPCRCGSVGCWETEVGEGMLLALAGYPADAGRSGIDAVLREADAGSESALAALAHVGRWLGIGLGGLVNVLDPRLMVLGGPLARIHPLRPRPARGGARAALRCRRRVRSSASSRRRSGSTRRCIGAAELAFEPLLADPATWFARPDPSLSSRAPDVGARVRPIDGIDSPRDSGDWRERGLPNDVG